MFGGIPVMLHNLIFGLFWAFTYGWLGLCCETYML
jgi:hypothetical protein